MVVENLGLSFALNWIYDTFSSSQSHKAVEADVCPSRDQREKYNNFAASPSKDDRSIGADDDVAGELSMTSGLQNIFILIGAIRLRRRRWVLPWARQYLRHLLLHELSVASERPTPYY